MLKESIETAPVEFEITPWWRCAEVGDCETLLCHKKLGHQPTPIPGRIRHLLEDGKAHEKDIVERWMKAGAVVLHSCIDGQVEIRVSEKPWVLGHPDGILDLPKDFPRTLDRWDDNFDFNLRFYLLEITAPNHFLFQQVKSEGLRVAMWTKFVQIQRYLQGEEVRSYTNCCVASVKNKNTSEIYEEGISRDLRVAEENDGTLLRLETLLKEGKVSDYRCNDRRKEYCRFRHLCFEEEGIVKSLEFGMLKAEDLKEAEELLQALLQWKRYKGIREDANEMVEDSREYFRSVLKDYGQTHLQIQDVVAQIYEQTRRSTDLDLLKRKYREAYNEVVSSKTSEVLRVA